MNEYICAVCGRELPEKEGTFRLVMRANRTKDTVDAKYRASVCHDCHLILKRMLFRPDIEKKETSNE